MWKHGVRAHSGRLAEVLASVDSIRVWQSLARQIYPYQCCREDNLRKVLTEIHIEKIKMRNEWFMSTQDKLV
jgi:hypothetical protein